MFGNILWKTNLCLSSRFVLSADATCCVRPFLFLRRNGFPALCRVLIKAPCWCECLQNADHWVCLWLLTPAVSQSTMNTVPVSSRDLHRSRICTWLSTDITSWDTDTLHLGFCHLLKPSNSRKQSLLKPPLELRFFKETHLCYLCWSKTVWEIPDSPVPSSVSMRSDCSIDEPIEFKGGGHPGQQMWEISVDVC